MENNKLPERKNNRLKDWDYSANGCYFITICTESRKHILSRFNKTCVGDGFPVPELTKAGNIIDDYINNINMKYPDVKVDKYVIMPNHIHMLLFIDKKGTGNPSPTVGNIIGWFKYNTTKSINELSGISGKKIWQRSYYDHIIRDERDYIEKRNYIKNNPQKWEVDKYYI